MRQVSRSLRPTHRPAPPTWVSMLGPADCGRRAHVGCPAAEPDPALLHPFHQGFWWLLIEPPLLVVLAGVVFALVVARPLIADMEARDAAAS